MEKKSHKGIGMSSQADQPNAEIGEDSDDHSLLADKQDSQSDIDTIEEEVDISQSEGSDHEQQQVSQTNAENNNELDLKVREANAPM
jgi:hypothetical protein